MVRTPLSKTMPESAPKRFRSDFQKAVVKPKKEELKLLSLKFKILKFDCWLTVGVGLPGFEPGFSAPKAERIIHYPTSPVSSYNVELFSIV